MNHTPLPLAASFLIRIALAAAISGLAYWKIDGMVSLVLTIPVWGVLLAKPILELLATYFDFARKQPYAKWQGHYYEFQGTQIRIFEDDGALWFCDRDILHVLDKTPEKSLHLTYPETDYRKLDDSGLMAFSEMAVLRVVARIRHPATGKLKFWLEREVIAPFHKKREVRVLTGGARSDK